MRILCIAPMIAWLLCHAPTTAAHTRSESYSHWYADETTLTATVTIPLREVMLLYEAGGSTLPPGERFRDELEARTEVSAAAGPCNRTSASVLQAASGFVRVEMRFECAGEPPETIRYRALFEAAPAHVHYAKLHRGNSRFETLITDTADTWYIRELDDVGSYSFASFLLIGIEHIGGGIDHIAFLIGMLLIAGALGRGIIAVTGFTLGHSISLGAAVLGYVHAESTLVEAFIGFTGALVAVEFFILRCGAIRSEKILAAASMLVAWIIGSSAFAFELISGRALLVYLGFGLFAVCYLLAATRLEHQEASRASALLFVATTCFGLVHGFGFAGFLMETGILGTSLFVPLLGFNLGVEIGQLILVALALGAVALARGKIPQFATPALAAVLCGVGVYWFVGRTLVL